MCIFMAALAEMWRGGVARGRFWARFKLRILLMIVIFAMLKLNLLENLAEMVIDEAKGKAVSL